MAIEINGKPIEIDFSKTDLGDWDLVARIGGGLKFEDIPLWVEFLDRALVGGKKAFPMTALADVVNAVAEELKEKMNPKAPAA